MYDFLFDFEEGCGPAKRAALFGESEVRNSGLRRIFGLYIYRWVSANGKKVPDLDQCRSGCTCPGRLHLVRAVGTRSETRSTAEQSVTAPALLLE
jgi:hypothetical protein